MTTKSDNCLIMHIAIIKVKHKIILAGHSMILQPVYLDIYMPIRNFIYSNKKNKMLHHYFSFKICYIKNNL